MSYKLSLLLLTEFERRAADSAEKRVKIANHDPTLLSILDACDAQRLACRNAELPQFIDTDAWDDARPGRLAGQPDQGSRQDR